VGKRVRSSTDIGANSVSISTAAVTLVKRVFEDLEGRRILIVGAGEMSELTAQYLYELGAKSVVVTNRTFSRAKDVAEKFNGKAVEFVHMGEYLGRVDIVISSTAAPGYVIAPEMVKRARRASRGHSLLLIDIALPRDIDPACNKISDVYVYDIDDLESIVELHREERKAEAEKAKLIVLEEVEGFKAWYQALSVKPTIAQIRQKANNIVEDEVARALKRLPEAGEREREIIEAMANAIIKKVLHGPTARLNAQASNPDAVALTESARFLFGLDSNPDGRVTCNSDCDNCPKHKDAILRGKGLLACQQHLNRGSVGSAGKVAVGTVGAAIGRPQNATMDDNGRAMRTPTEVTYDRPPNAVGSGNTAGAGNAAGSGSYNAAAKLDSNTQALRREHRAS
jgi:glutamyl-tRNA reductase